MAYTQADIDALRARIITFAGIRGTAHGDRSTQFDIDSARVLLAEMERRVNGTDRSYRIATVDKGV